MHQRIAVNLSGRKQRTQILYLQGVARSQQQVQRRTFAATREAQRGDLIECAQLLDLLMRHVRSVDVSSDGEVSESAAVPQRSKRRLVLSRRIYVLIEEMKHLQVHQLLRHGEQR